MVWRKDGPIFVFGEAMIELSGVTATGANIGVGGDTFNTAVYLARSGIETIYVTALGDCPFSRRILSILEGEGVSTAHVLTVPGESPGLYAIETDHVGERSFTYWRSTSAVRSFFDSPTVASTLDAMTKAKILYLTGIGLSLFPKRHQQNLIEIAQSVRSSGGTVVFDTNYRARGWASVEDAKEAIAAIAPYVSVALPTFEDEQALFGYRTVEDCIDAWIAAGAVEVCAKLGPGGAFLSDVGLVPPPVIVNPIDTTGAGDSFNAAYMAARRSGATLQQAAVSGHRLAAQVLGVQGALILT